MQKQLRRTIKQRYRQARAEERLRRTLWRVSKNDEQSLTTAITRMRTVIKSRLELVRSKKNLYQQVNKVFQSAQLPYLPELVTIVHLEPEQLRSRPGTRSICVWSADATGSTITTFSSMALPLCCWGEPCGGKKWYSGSICRSCPFTPGSICGPCEHWPI